MDDKDKIRGTEGTDGDMAVRSGLPLSPHQRQQKANVVELEQDRRSSPRRIRVLTLNVWGIKHIAISHTDRLRAIAAHIVTPTATGSAPPPPSPDIVALQELFTYSDYLVLRRLTRHILPHGVFFHNGAFGAGLVILSRWRIGERRMEGYLLNGRPSAYWRGDWYVGKGVACARVRLPWELWAGNSEEDGEDGEDEKETEKGGNDRGSGYLQIFNTHLHAPYGEGKDKDSGKAKDTYACHRVCQAWQIGGMMRRAMERGDVVVGCGDFNMVVAGLEYRVLLNQADAGGGRRLRDVWRELHPDSSVGAWIDSVGDQGSRAPTVRESLHLHGHTCDSIANTWRWSKSHQKDLRRKGKDRVIGLDELDPKAKRLDYIFLGDGTAPLSGVSGEGGRWTVSEARVCMTERHPSMKCSLSDHFGVETEIVWSPTPSPSKGQAQGRDTDHPDPGLHGAMLSLIYTYTDRALRHRRLRLLHFLLSLLVSVGCHIAIWFTNTPQLRPPYVPFILMLLSTLGLASGVVDGLIGGLFCGVELRRLKMFEGSVSNDLHHPDGSAGHGEHSEDAEEEQMGKEGEDLDSMRVKDWWD